MSRFQTYSIVIGLMLSALLIGLTPKVLGQGRERNQTQPANIPRVPVFKGTGGAATRVTSRKLPPPPPAPQLLSSVFRNQIFNQLGGKPVAEYCKVTPQVPYIADRCYLEFDNFQTVRIGQNWTLAHNQTLPAFASFNIKPFAAGKKYLIDCAVHKFYNELQSLNVNGNFDTSPQFPASVSPTNNHLLLALHATSSNWIYFSISKYDLTPFYFYGCTATEYVPQASPSTIRK
jgi:hypothetical protein